MSHDHDALQLAVASLDFELTRQEQARMRAGLLDCEECAAVASSHADLQRLLGRLPVRDASAEVRQRVLRSALVPPRDRQWPVLLAAAALLALLIGAAAAAGAFREPTPLDGAVTLPSSSPPALGDVESAQPTATSAQGSPAPGQGPPGGPTVGTALVPDTLAKVVSGRLRIRSEPRVAADSIKYEPLLAVGDHLLILDGPVVANDYEWYQITAWRPGNLYASFPVGWVSRGDHDGTPWISARADACPSGVITMEIVSTLHPEERVACFADRPLRLRAFVMGGATTARCVPDPAVACVDGPVWLTGLGGWRSMVDAQVETPSIGGPHLALDPDGPVAASELPEAGMLDIEGAFDHPASADCRPGATGPGAQPLTEPGARLACRMRFVVTKATVDDRYPAAGTPGITVSPNLRVRSGPGLTSERFELLVDGTSVWVAEGPVVAADYEWFKVIVPLVDAGAGVPRVGWVAASDHGAERWLARRTIDCPAAGAVRVADLARLLGSGYGDGGLACFGPSTIRFEGDLGLVCNDRDRPTWEWEPAWLSGNASRKLTISDGAARITARPHESLDVPLACGDGAGRLAIEAHFDDEAATDCAGASARDAAPGVEVGDVAWLWCRATLVVDRLTQAPV
jgi:hypothetical protein